MENTMTIAQAKEIYVFAGGNPDHSESEWNDITKEINAVVNARSDRAAGQIIQWWGCWDRKLTATAFARKVRLKYHSVV